MATNGPDLGNPATFVTVPGPLGPEQGQHEEADQAHLQETLDTYKDSLQEAGHAPAAHGWLQTALQTKRGTAELYSQLQQYVQKPAFLQKLIAARSQSQVAVGAAESSVPVEQDVAPTCPEQRHPQEDVMQASFWEEPAPDAAVPSPDEDLEGLVEEQGLGGYVLVEKQDVLDAIGTFVAAYLATVPEAQNMKPAELQQALSSTFRDLRRGNVRKFWEWGRCAYRCIAFSYGAFSVYENPWLVRAVVTALWTAGKVMLGLLI